MSTTRTTQAAYDELAELLMTAPSYPTVPFDLLQRMLRDYRSLCLAVESSLHVSVPAFVEAAEKARRTGEPPVQYVPAAPVKEPVKAQARYTHDCNDCEFLGTLDYMAPMTDGSRMPQTRDLYVCRGPASSSLGGTIVARFGNHCAQYESMPMNAIVSLIDSVERRDSKHAAHAWSFIEGFRRAGGIGWPETKNNLTKME